MSTELIHLIFITLEYINPSVQCYLNEDIALSKTKTYA